MQTGIDLELASLRTRHPGASAAEIDVWLRGEDEP